MSLGVEGRQISVCELDFEYPEIVNYLEAAPRLRWFLRLSDYARKLSYSRSRSDAHPTLPRTSLPRTVRASMPGYPVLPIKSIYALHLFRYPALF